MQEKQGVQQDLLESSGTKASAPAEVVRGPVGDAALRAARGPEQDFIGACPDCGSQLAFIEGCAKMSRLRVFGVWVNPDATAVVVTPVTTVH